VLASKPEIEKRARRGKAGRKRNNGMGTAEI
jgi:hypothetical protein